MRHSQEQQAFVGGIFESSDGERWEEAWVADERKQQQLSHEEEKEEEEQELSFWLKLVRYLLIVVICCWNWFGVLSFFLWSCFR